MSAAENIQTENFLRLSSDDNVVVAIQQLAAGDRVGDIAVLDAIPMGHKVATQPIATGQTVIKYGHSIGIATSDIAAGEHVHQHNLRTALGETKLGKWSAPSGSKQSPAESPAFSGYASLGGRVAARNEIWIVNTVACVNQTATRLADRANHLLVTEFHNIDGYHAFPHPYGCSQLGDDLSTTRQILAGLANHPHAGGVLILGLGCENNQIVEQIKSVDAEKLKTNVVYFNTQDVADELEQGLEALRQLSRKASARKRESVPSRKLILGMKCGGSDGLSGITANPLLGRVADRHCASGGTVLLTEVPEMFGAEQVLLSRCASADVHRQLVDMVDKFKAYFRSHGQPISENPSPGNREGGISTLEEKSLGCVQKSGTNSLIKQVLAYGAQAAPDLAGVALINSPGNDGVSTTALTAAGANIILFTTGRGTPLGAPVPTIKVSTNSELAESKPAWIDFDAGRLINGTANLDQMADSLYEFILQVAAGQQTKNETNGYREIAIWKTGVTL